MAKRKGGGKDKSKGKGKEQGEFPVGGLPEELKGAAHDLGFRKQCTLKKLHRIQERDRRTYALCVGFTVLMVVLSVGLLVVDRFRFEQFFYGFIFVALWGACSFGVMKITGRRREQAAELGEFLEKRLGGS